MFIMLYKFIVWPQINKKKQNLKINIYETFQ